jgi:2-polyprenyl-3-methyl-5-hydroxy-6-metoxy-1,4-benzoquinol methylase
MDTVRCANCGSAEQSLLTETTNVGTTGLPRLNVMVCSQCGLAFLNPQPTAKMYTAFYTTYGRKKTNVPALIKEKEDQRGYIDILAPYLTKDSSVLDVGCGKGIFLSFLKERGYTNLSGLELSKDEIAFAQEQFGISVQYGDIADYAGVVDAITMIAVIEHYKDPAQRVRIARDKLADGGFLFVSTPNVKRMVLRKGLARYFKFVHTYYFSLTTLTSVIQQAGFEIVYAHETSTVLTRSALFPRHYTDSDLLVLARKVAVPGPLLTDDPQELKTLLAHALKRDWASACVAYFDSIPGFGFLINTVRRFVK